jgi:arginine decarboxylase
MHELVPDEEYYLGAFLVGAYQETLGDLHNLLGDTNVVSVSISPDGRYEIVKEIQGDSVESVLSYVEFEPKNLVARFRETAEKAVRDGLISPMERKQIMDAYEAGLRGYTYFER